ncbi:MAG: tetratricopeptide repeat protein [Bacteroidia bacterium]|nr:tetratricopeptide repeat protein [Bacteroidia bacterium]
MQKTLVENRVTLLLPIANSAKNENYEKLFQAISKGKSDIECILILSGNQSKTEEFKKGIAYQELAQKEKVTILSNLQSAFQNANGTLCVFIEDIEKTNVQAVLSAVQSKRKKLNDTTLYFGSYLHKESNNKKGFISKLSAKAYNSFVRFISSSNVQDNKSGVYIAYTQFAEELFATKLSHASNYFQIANQCGAHNIPTEDFALTADANSPSGSFLQIFTLPFISLYLSFKFFVLSSLHEIKFSKQRLQYKSGDSPIYRLIFYILVVGFCLSYPILSQQYGMTWDEKQHDEYSKVAYNWVVTFGDDTAALAESTGSHDYVRQIFRNYGEHMNLIAALIYNTFDTDPYNTRHFIISLYGLLGLICVGLTLKALTSWRGAIIALLFIGFNPGWLGFSMNNPTDIPFAVGFAVSGYFMVRVLQHMPNPKSKHITWLGIGIGIGIGSRVGALLIIAYMGLFLGLQWLFYCIKNKKGIFSKGVEKYIFTLMRIAVLGYLFGISLWPYALSNPIKNVFTAFKKSSENAFYANNTELFEGKRLYMLTEAPGYYVVKFLSIGNPIYLLAGIALTMALAFWMKKYIKVGYVLMFVFMLVFPIAWAEYTNLNYYNGWRHYLFVLPAMVVLSAMAYEFLFYTFKNKIVQVSILVVLVLAFGKPLLWQIKNHPNQYVYFNEFVGGINGAYGNYETDYYSNSCREAGEWIAKQEPNKKVLIGINNEPLTASYYAHRINPNLDFFWVREYEEYKPRWDYLILTSRTYSKNELLNGSFPPKGTVHVIKADDIPLCVIVKRENNFMPDGYEALARKQADSAIQFFEQAVKYEPMNEEAQRMLGQSYMVAGKFQQAETALKKAIEIYPENYSAYSTLGQVWFMQQKPDSALYYFDKALFYKRNVTEAYFYAGQCAMQKNDFSKAVSYFEGGVSHNGNVPEMYDGLGVAYLNLANYSLAESAFSAALSLNPNYAPAYYYLVKVFEHTNEPAKAKECARRYQLLSEGKPIQ